VAFGDVTDVEGPLREPAPVDDTVRDPLRGLYHEGEVTVRDPSHITDLAADLCIEAGTIQDQSDLGPGVGEGAGLLEAFCVDPPQDPARAGVRFVFGRVIRDRQLHAREVGQEGDGLSGLRVHGPAAPPSGGRILPIDLEALLAANNCVRSSGKP